MLFELIFVLVIVMAFVTPDRKRPPPLPVAKLELIVLLLIVSGEAAVKLVK